MAFLAPVGGLVWEIVWNTVVTNAVPWLSEFLSQRIVPLWQTYWPVIYQSFLVPAYHLVSDTILPLLHDLLSNGDSFAAPVSESPPEGPMPIEQISGPPDLDSPTITNVSNGQPSDHEDIAGRSVSEPHTPLDGRGTPEPHIDQNVLGRALQLILDSTSNLSSYLEDVTRRAAPESDTLIEGGTPSLDKNILGRASKPIINPSSNRSSGHEDITEISVSDSATSNDGETPPHDQNILDRALDPVLNPTASWSSDNVDITGISEAPTRSEGGIPPHDQNILGLASETVLNPTSSISSDNEDITGIPVSGSPTQSGGVTLASVDVNFFREYDEGKRYRIEKAIGKGSRGVVFSAYDTQLREKVAIKKISDVFRHVSDATRILREIKLLRLLRHPDIVEIKHILLPPSRDFKDIYVIFELTECDLRNIIRVNDGLTPEHCRFFLYQLLRGLKYIHTANVFHRDLDPKNVLTIADVKIKMHHFYHAFVDTPTGIFCADYVATRWYKAPELCGVGQFFSKYSAAMDIWSIGCIFAELLTGKPLFPGENPVHQLDLTTDLLGTPSPESIAKIKNERARTILSSMQKKRPIPFPQKFPNADPLALVLLKRLLAFDPEDRPSAEEALADPYFNELARVEREPSAQPVTEAEFAFERLFVTKEDIQELMYREILQYHPKLLKEHMEILEPNGSQSSSRRRRMLARVGGVASILHNPHPS